MKYLMMVKLNRNSQAGQQYDAGMPPDPRLAEAMGKHMEETIKAGVLVDTGGLMPFAKGAQVRASGGKLTVTDGPFIESKEVIGGYAIIKASSRPEAIEMGRKFMQLHVDVLGPSYEGELEIREMFDAADCAKGSANL